MSNVLILQKASSPVFVSPQAPSVMAFPATTPTGMMAYTVVSPRAWWSGSHAATEGARKLYCAQQPLAAWVWKVVLVGLDENLVLANVNKNGTTIKQV